MNEMLRRVMMVSYVLGIALTVVAAALKAASLAGAGAGYQAGNWGVGACALFLCALASERMAGTARG